MLSRRELGSYLAMLGVAACANKTADQLQADVNLIVAGLNSIIPTLQGLPAGTGPSPGTIAQIQAALDDLAANAANIGTSLAPNSNVAQQIANIVSTISSLAAPFFSLAPTLNSIFQAAYALLISVLAMAKAPVPAAARSKAGSMTPAQARAVLAAAAR